MAPTLPHWMHFADSAARVEPRKLTSRAPAAQQEQQRQKKQGSEEEVLVDESG